MFSWRCFPANIICLTTLFLFNCEANELNSNLESKNVYQLIPAALITTGQCLPLREMYTPELRRATRQHQTAVVKNLVINQNLEHFSQPVNIQSFKSSQRWRPKFFNQQRPQHHHHHHHGFDDDDDDHRFHPAFFGRSNVYQQPETPETAIASSLEQIPCPTSYLISCDVNSGPVSCASASSSPPTSSSCNQY